MFLRKSSYTFELKCSLDIWKGQRGVETPTDYITAFPNPMPWLVSCVEARKETGFLLLSKSDRFWLFSSYNILVFVYKKERAFLGRKCIHSHICRTHQILNWPSSNAPPFEDGHLTLWNSFYGLVSVQGRKLLAWGPSSSSPLPKPNLTLLILLGVELKKLAVMLAVCGRWIPVNVLFSTSTQYS